MRLKWCVTGFLLFVFCAGVQLHAQQTNADSKLFEETKAKAEKGDADAQATLGLDYFSGLHGIPQDYTKAANWFRKAAEQGNAVAEFYLGFLYQLGSGVPKNMSEGLKWNRKAAEQGFAMAQWTLGGRYEFETNFVEAAKWYRKAAEQDFSLAQLNLGVCYAKGNGVAKDFAEAVKWYHKAAEQGIAVAQCDIGSCYYLGDGVPKDYLEAYKWLNLASAQGFETAKKCLSIIEQQMTPEQISEAQQLAREFKPRKAAWENSSMSNANSNSNPKFSGTGFFITDDGYLISNYHVVKDATKVRLLTSAGLIDAKVVQVDAANDLALLKADGRFAPLPIAASRTVALGGTVATIGFPNIGMQGFAPKLAKGEIASLSGAADDPRYFQISVPVQPGNSGGALVDERGNVIGIVSAKLNASAALAASGSLPENVNYAVKSSLLLSFLESVPAVSAKLKEPVTADRKFEDVVKSAQDAAVLVLVY
jgi:TPR repeat protein